MKVFFWIVSAVLMFTLFIVETMNYLYEWYAYSQGFSNANNVEGKYAFWAAVGFVLFLASVFALKYRVNRTQELMDIEEEEEHEKAEKRFKDRQAVEQHGWD